MLAWLRADRAGQRCAVLACFHCRRLSLAVLRTRGRLWGLNFIALARGVFRHLPRSRMVCTFWFAARLGDAEMLPCGPLHFKYGGRPSIRALPAHTPRCVFPAGVVLCGGRMQ